MQQQIIDDHGQQFSLSTVMFAISLTNVNWIWSEEFFSPLLCIINSKYG